MSYVSDTTLESTGEALKAQWRMPQEVLGLLLIVGPEIVQKALSQCAPNRLPVAFSFGWVGYSFSAMTSLLGDGRLMSECDKTVAILRGNGGRHVMMVRGDKNLEASLDLEDLATSESARLARPWEKYGWFVSRPKPLLAQQTNGSQDTAEKGTAGSEPVVMTHKLLSYLPADFWFTRLACGLLLALWVTLLICVSGMTSDTWYLFAVGALGSLHNAYAAATGIGARSRHLPLARRFYIAGSKVMDVLMDLERMHAGAGEALIDEFFPGGFDEARGEKEWWDDVSKRVVFCNQGKMPAASDRPALATNTIVAGSLIGTYDQKRLQHPTRATFGLHTHSE